MQYLKSTLPWENGPSLSPLPLTPPPAPGAEPSLVTPIGATGLGVAGASHLANKATRQLIDTRVADPTFLRDASLFAASNKDYPEDFVQLYATHGSNMVRQQVGQGGGRLAVADALPVAKQRIGEFLGRSIPEKMRPAFLDGYIKSFEGAAHDPSTLEHYQAFKRGPMDAYRQLVSELAPTNISTDSAKFPLLHWKSQNVAKGLPGVLTQALQLPVDQRDAFIKSQDWGINKGREGSVDFGGYLSKLEQNLGIRQGSSPESIASAVRAHLTQGGANVAVPPELSGLLSKAQTLEDLPTVFRQALQLPPEERDAFIKSQDWGINKSTKANFGKYFETLSRDLGVSHKNTPEEIAHALRTKLLPQVSSPTLVGHLNEWLDGSKFKHISETSYKATPLSKFGELLIAARMHGAPSIYNNYTRVARGMGALSSSALRHGALGVAALSAAPWLMNKFQESKQAGVMEQQDPNNTGAMLSTMLPAFGSAALGSSALAQYQQQGPRKLNPFAKIQGMVIGGEDTGRGSFASQAKELVKSLRHVGLKNTRYRPAYHVEPMQDPRFPTDPTKTVPNYLPVPEAGAVQSKKNLDYLVQVGSHPEDSLIHSVTKGEIPRYRLLSDYGAGNVHQPDDWLWSRNWMKLHHPEQYARLAVPGGAALDVGGMRGQRANINIPTMAVNPIFGQTEFQPKLGAPPVTVVGVGGGSASSLAFRDTLSPVVHPPTAGAAGWTEHVYDPMKRSILDDLSEASHTAYGPQGRVRVLLGTAAENSGDFGEKFLKPILEQQRTGFTLPGAKLPRFHNIDFVSQIPQEQVAQEYARARNIVHLPGSTTAELMHMKGEHVPNIMNLIPDEELPWMPGHWTDNSKILKHHFPQSAREMSLVGWDPVAQLTDMFKANPVVQAGRKPLAVDMAPIAKAITRDVRLSRLGNLARFGGKVTGAAGLGALALSQAPSIFRGHPQTPPVPEQPFRWQTTPGPGLDPSLAMALPSMLGAGLGGVGSLLGGGNPLRGAGTGLGTGMGFTAGGLGGSMLASGMGVQDPTARALLSLGGAGLGAYAGNRIAGGLVGNRKRGRDEEE